MLTERGLLEAKGATKGRRYGATPVLSELAYRGFQALGELPPLKEPYGARLLMR